ncbi:flagellar M-ring protein FliF [Roseivivax lentus]|uniref:Flagellar M-ring protein n=1 Tax=Roseivivax lentus TaxID=633194 RepID=A0A1N7JR05_9RHOB|nr:flagellar basal-body MS-ring/collar protein FliF [Roseivivax lentus]SIS51666.1 flagellar M-ring protein FliF [Roseivivax lentus]
MPQLLALWNGLSLGRKLAVALSTAAMFAAVLGLARMASQPDMALLYAGLEPQAAADVVAAIESSGIPFEVQGGAIMVPRAERDALRLTLAGEGLPANNAQGYELLDSLTGFGTTSQMFDAAYWRAKEGELARTILATPQVSAARVHIAMSAANPFQREVTPSASVSVTGANGVVDAERARAIRYLVASAVPGLVPDDVSVIDSRGGLIGAEDAQGLASSEDRAEALRNRVQRIVEARVGAGNAVVAVSVDTVTESEQIRERRLDPDGRVAISSDTEERSEQSNNQGNGDVTVASNLPDGEAGGGDSSSAQQSETRERVNYEVSETTREILRAPGAISRLTVAVLVNGELADGPDGPVFTPLADEEQAALRDLVASAVGFNAERGDEITIRSMPFNAPEGLGTEAIAPGMFDTMALNPLRLIQIAVLALVALVLGLFVIRPILSRATTEPAALPAPQGLGAPELATSAPKASPLDEADTPLTGEIDMGDGFRPMGDSLPLGNGFAPLEDLSSEDPVDRLRTLIGERKEETVEILRSWLEDRPEESR